MGAKAIGEVTRQRVWAAMVRLGEFTYRDVSAVAGIEERRVGVLAREWEAEGKLERIEAPGALRARCRLRIRRPQETVPGFERVQSPESNMWKAMCVFGAFSPADVAASATTDVVNITIGVARAYCQMLSRAGYLRVVEKAVPGRREACYRLVQKTGPQAPVGRRVHAVWDPNLGEYTHVPKVAT